MNEIDKKTNSNKTKHLIVENYFTKLKKFNSSYFRGKTFFDDDGTQNMFSISAGKTNTLKQLVPLIIVFLHKNLNDCLMKRSNLVHHQVLVLL